MMSFWEVQLQESNGNSEGVEMLLPVMQSQKEIRKKSKKWLKQEIVCDIAIPSMFCNLCSYGGCHKWIPKI
jgi:hypothetical protein